MTKNIPGEKKCEVCGCMFVNKEDSQTVRCKGCAGVEVNVAGINEQYVYQDIKRSDIEAKLNLCLAKLDTLLKLHKAETKKETEYSHKCETCGQVFVNNAAASKYCDECKAK